MRKKKYDRIIAVDAGSVTSGIVMLDIDQDTKKWRMHTALAEADNSTIMKHIKSWSSSNDERVIVLIEDVKPYSLKLNQDVIDTIKYIGELRYCLKRAGIAYLEVSRSTIKEWVKLQYGYIVNKLLAKKVEYRSKMNDRLVLEGKLEKNNLVKKDGELKAATFVWIDDRMIQAAMRVQWSIERPKVGQSNKYGLKSHSWQALALVTYYLKTY